MDRSVICIDNREYPASLEMGKCYRVVPDARAEAAGLLRVVDDSGEDYLFPSTLFRDSAPSANR
jgi:hypothetical protein